MMGRLFGWPHHTGDDSCDDGFLAIDRQSSGFGLRDGFIRSGRFGDYASWVLRLGC